jgi:hypothetical protein
MAGVSGLMSAGETEEGGGDEKNEELAHCPITSRAPRRGRDPAHMKLRCCISK